MFEFKTTVPLLAKVDRIEFYLTSIFSGGRKICILKAFNLDTCPEGVRLTVTSNTMKERLIYQLILKSSEHTLFSSLKEVNFGV